MHFLFRFDAEEFRDFLVRPSLGFYCTGPCSKIAHGRIVYILVQEVCADVCEVPPKHELSKGC